MPMFPTMFRRALVPAALAGALLLTACAGTPAAPNALYDFGLAPAASAGSRLPTALRVAEVSGPGWMDGNAIYYRLAYAQGQRTEAYAASRWVESPVSLFDARLRNAVAGASDAELPEIGRCQPLLRGRQSLMTDVLAARLGQWLRPDELAALARLLPPLRDFSRTQP